MFEAEIWMAALQPKVAKKRQVVRPAFFSY
jgi:hypothetical protein